MGDGSSMIEWIILFLVVSALAALLIGFVCRSGATGGVAMIDDDDMYSDIYDSSSGMR